MTRPTYIAALPILHNGMGYEPGDVFDATAPEADVAHLLESGALIPEGVALRAADAPAHPGAPDGPAHASAAEAAEVPAADAVRVLRTSIADIEASIEALEARVALLEDEPGDTPEIHRQAIERIERRLDVLEGTAPPPASPSREERHAGILEAIGQLDRTASGDWTASGPPTVAALERLTGLTDLTAAERDAAWAAVQSGR